MAKKAPARSKASKSAAVGGPVGMDWSDRYALGIELIDSQHKVLFRLIDQLAKAIQANDGTSGLQEVFDKLKEYTLTHFAAEEHLMEQHGYHASREHHANHLALEQSLAHLAARAAEGEPLLSLQTMNFLRQWLYQHIDHVDRAFADFLKDKGVS